MVIDLDSPTGPTVNTTASSSGTISVKTKVPVTTNGLHTVLAVGSSDRNTAHASYRVAASLDLSPTSVRAGGTLHTSLTGFDAHQTVTLRLRSPTGTALAQVTTGAKGQASTSVKVPTGATPGNNRIYAVTAGGPRTSASLLIR